MLPKMLFQTNVIVKKILIDFCRFLAFEESFTLIWRFFNSFPDLKVILAISGLFLYCIAFAGQWI